MDEYIGTVKLFAGTYTPKGYMFCDGITLNTKDYPTLGAVLGVNATKPTKFKLPDLEAPKGINYIICVEGNFPPKY